MICDGCHNQEAYLLKCTADGTWCDRCGNLSLPWVPDAFFQKPYLDPNLAHPNRPEEANGVMVYSKRHKEILMREQGLREMGDRRHGAINYDPGLSRKR